MKGRTLILRTLFLSIFICFSCAGILYAQDDSIYARPFIVNRIIVTGNNVTRLHIITRELIIHQGDTLPPGVFENALIRSRENLMNTGLFNFVEINKYPDAANKTDVHINLTERWYIWPFPFFEVVDRNFNEWWLTKDFNRTNYGLYLVKENFRGRDESLKLQVRLGYSQRFGLFYNIPYINKSQNLGISFGGFYTRNREIAYASEENKLLYYKDPDRFIRKDWNCYSRLTLRSGIYDYYSAAVEYRRIDVSDSIVNRNPEYFAHGVNMQQQLSLAWTYRRDQRDYQPYPLKGHLFQIDIVKTGLDILKYEPDVLSVNMTYRRYLEWHKRWHTSIAVSGKLSGKTDTPYVNFRALGYGSDVVRGYEYYVINGNDFILFKANLLKYTLLKTRIYNIPFIGSEKFRKVPNTIYFSLSADAGYVNDRQFYRNNPLGNSWLSGYGAGIDYVTYYDLVLRFEYSFNNLGEHGFFVNFAAPF